MIDVFIQENTKKFYEKLHNETLEVMGIDKDGKNTLESNPIFRANIEAVIRCKGVSERVKNPKPLIGCHKMLWELFTPFTESITSIENIFMISIFIRQYPNYPSFRSNEITPAKYLRYHVENYLNEVYIFNMRIDRLLRVIEKWTSRNNIDSNEQIARSRKMLKIALSGVISTPGKHIHHFRFEEDSLDHLAFLDLMSRDAKMKQKLFILNKLAYRIDRAKWARDISRSAKSLSKILDSVLKEVYPVIFDEVLPKIKNL